MKNILGIEIENIQKDEEKDWGGNAHSTYVQLGSSNHTDKNRELSDFYATDPKSLEIFLNRLEKDNIEFKDEIWECACGEGHLVNVLKERFPNLHIRYSDIVDRGYKGTEKLDFLQYNEKELLRTNILTNPPYKYAQQFVEHSMEMIEDGYYVIMYLKVQFLEGKSRYEMYQKYPLKYIYVNSERQVCAMNGDFEKFNASTLCYCWFVWQKGYTGEPIVRWLI